MSNNYDMIANVAIDIKSSIVDAASFDNILIVGPLPKKAPAVTPASVGKYTNIDKVIDAGWLLAEGAADPVAVAAQIAFSQKPQPSAVYIAPILETEEGTLEKAVDTVKRAVGTSGWYVVCVAGVESSEYEDIAKYIETQEKMFCYTDMSFFDEGDAPIVTKDYFRTLGIFGKLTSSQAEEEVSEPNKYLNVAFATKWLNYQSGTETAAYKTLESVQPSLLSSDEMSNLKESNINYFITVGGKNITMGGMVLAGEWADIIRFRDWLKNDMQTRVVDLFVTNPKIPFTNGGIALIENQMRASLKAGQDLGGIAQDEYDDENNSLPGYITSVPTAASITPTEKSKRKIENLSFKARLAGAIQFSDINGSLAYEL